MKKSYSICFFVSIILLAFIEPAFTQTSQQPARTTQQQAEYELMIQQFQEQQKFLQNQIKEHREFVEKNYTKHFELAESSYNRLFNLLTLFTALATVFITIVGAALGFFGWRTFSKIPQKIDQLYEERALSYIDAKNRSLRIEIDQLERIVARETKYLDRKILFLANENDIEKLSSRDIPILKQRGLLNIDLVANTQNLDSVIHEQSHDVIAYYYDPSPTNPKEIGDRILRELLEGLNSNKIPVVIYTYEKGERNMLYPVDMQAVVNYPYAVFANFPITLVNLLHTVANYFPTHR